jgi:hypothetical protein
MRAASANQVLAASNAMPALCSGAAELLLGWLVTHQQTQWHQRTDWNVLVI